jgi:hypothetical protein
MIVKRFPADKGYCARVKLDTGLVCGSTSGLQKNQNLCKRCKSERNRDYKKDKRLTGHNIYYKDEYVFAGLVRQMMQPWDELTRAGGR